MLELVLGGARSGKSHYAQTRALQSGRDVCVVVTADADDDEMRERIQLHQQQRPAHWRTLESPLQLANTLQGLNEQACFIIVDCLTLWLSNLLIRTPNQVDQELTSLLRIVPALKPDVIFVSNEVGMGVVPLGKLSRQFVDEAGRLHQRLAQQCHKVTQVIAGIPHVIKQTEC